MPWHLGLVVDNDTAVTPPGGGGTGGGGTGGGTMTPGPVTYGAAQTNSDGTYTIAVTTPSDFVTGDSYHVTDPQGRSLDSVILSQNISFIDLNIEAVRELAPPPDGGEFVSGFLVYHQRAGVISSGYAITHVVMS